MMTAERQAGTREGPVRGAEPERVTMPDFRRGACPTLAAPMETGDGLLVRLRPASGFFTPSAFLALLDAAETFGNGRLDITARGNLQVRGLTPDSAPRLEQAVRTAGISVTEGVAVETSPLAGVDASEIADPSVLAGRLSARIATSGLVLAPKLSVIVDGGGQLHLRDVPADLRVVAERVAEGDVPSIVWHLFVGAGDAQPAASGTAQAIEEAAMAALRRIASLGPQGRARDLSQPACPSVARMAHRPTSPARSPVGRIVLDDQVVLGVAPAFGQMEAAHARRLVQVALEQGVDELRLAPARALLFLGLTAQTVPIVEACGADLGFVTRPSDPSLRIDACTGAGGCASGGMDTQATARWILNDAPALMDGSLDLHLSGCPKGCARPRVSDITLVAVPAERGHGRRLGLVLAGRASNEPIATTALDHAASALAALGDQVGQAKQSGESAASCLKRLGPARIAASFQRD